MADAALLASLQAATNLSIAELADLNTLATSSPRFGAGGDELLARNLWREELLRHSATLQDRRMAMDLQQALRENRTVEAVRRDRQAREASAASGVPRSAGPVDAAAELKRRRLERFGVYAPPRPETALHGLGSTMASTSTAATASSSASTAPAQCEDCYICGDGHDKRNVRLECGHLYCYPCLRELFLIATKDEALNPAACCKRTVDQSHLSKVLTPAQHTAYLDAVKEFGAPDRLYCANPVCSAFLGAGVCKGRIMRVCNKCSAKTCQACKAPWHLSDAEACVADTDEIAGPKVAQLVRGVCCHKCKRVVMRNGGCPHVVCRCGVDLQVPG
ncbi:hypothetical protein JCM10450v2_006974 [Rhodotorula kratochvilovae]